MRFMTGGAVFSLIPVTQTIDDDGLDLKNASAGGCSGESDNRAGTIQPVEQ